MDLRRLSFLVKVVEMGSITRAADALAIAQPALSQHIQALERSFGAPLLHREAHGVRPTEAGEVVYRNAKLVARQMDRARAEVKALAGAPAGRVTVGVTPQSHARSIIQPLLLAVRERHPAIVLHISENFEGVLAADLLLKRVDMALLYEIVARPGFRYALVREERLQVVGRESLLAGTAEQDAARLPLLLPQSSHALRQLIDATFSAAGEQPTVLAEVEGFETLVAAVRAGLGATILPASVAQTIVGGGDLRSRPFGGAGTRLALWLCAADEDVQSTAVNAVRALVAELIGGLAEEPAPPPGAVRSHPYPSREDCIKAPLGSPPGRRSGAYPSRTRPPSGPARETG